MPLTILLLVCLGQLLLGFGVATALLLAAALAPTDPVLASDVQVGPPKSGEEDDARFALTSEAGLNDGLAFPFVMCAIAISLENGLEWGWFLRWVAVDVVFRLVAGIGIGVLLGYVLGLLVSLAQSIKAFTHRRRLRCVGNHRFRVCDCGDNTWLRLRRRIFCGCGLKSRRA